MVRVSQGRREGSMGDKSGDNYTVPMSYHTTVSNYTPTTMT